METKFCEKCSEFREYHEIVECITGALDARDPLTAGHSQRVSDMTIALCHWMNLPEDLCEQFHIAAHLHDVGKIGIPDAVLFKEGPLSTFEWTIMKSHSDIGADILGKSEHLKEISVIVRYHHERYDGNGYPSGRKGNEIPLGSRVIAICDSIDAMLSKRSYRDQMSREFCREQIATNSGKMYDPEIVPVALQHWDDLLAQREK